MRSRQGRWAGPHALRRDPNLQQAMAGEPGGGCTGQMTTDLRPGFVQVDGLI